MSGCVCRAFDVLSGPYSVQSECCAYIMVRTQTAEFIIFCREIIRIHKQFNYSTRGHITSIRKIHSKPDDSTTVPLCIRGSIPLTCTMSLSG